MLTVRECELCGEAFRLDPEDWPAEGEEIGEFINPETEGHVIAHASCGLERGWPIA